MYKDRADLQKAENDFRRTLELARKIGDERAEAVGLKNLGVLMKDNKRWDEALEQFQQQSCDSGKNRG